jgi:hypothetical protein
MSRAGVIDAYFLEHRAKLLDLAAFLDRVERTGGEPGAAASPADDYRLAAFRRALLILSDGRPERARRVQEAMSDPTLEPLASAAGLKGAFGAWAGAGTSG